MAEDADVIVVGGGLAGLVAATEIADAGKRVIVVDQEGEQSLGGQVNSGPMSYMVGSRQYVAVAAGSALFVYALRQ